MHITYVAQIVAEERMQNAQRVAKQFRMIKEFEDNNKAPGGRHTSGWILSSLLRKYLCLLKQAFKPNSAHQKIQPCL